MKKPTLLSSLGLVSLAVLAGCSSYKNADTKITDDTYRAQQILKTSQSVEAEPGPSTIRFKNEIWLGDRGVKSAHGYPLPSKFEKPNGFTLGLSNLVTLNEIATIITQRTGIPVTGIENVQDSGADTTVSDVPTVGMDATSPLGAGTDAALGSSSTSSSGGVGGFANYGRTMDVKYSGPLSGFLNSVAARFEVSWEYKNGVVRFFNVETKTYALIAAPSSSEIRTRIESAITGIEADNEGGSSSSTQGVTNNVKMDYWSNLKATMQAILPKNTQFSISPESGTVTVTASPAIQARVAEYMQAENKRLSRQVAISMKVYSLTLEDTDNYGVDVNGLFKNTNLGLSLTGLSNIGEDLSSLSIGILDSTTSNSLGKFAGSEALINALSTRGDVSLVTSASVTTLNNQPVPVQVATQKGYVKSVEKTTNDTDTSYSVEPGTITTGFSVNLLPRILEGNKVALQYNLALSDLTGLETIEFDGSMVQVPEVNTRGFLQNVMLNSGSTLVLAGYEKVLSSTSQSGTGDSYSWFMGGSKQAENQRQILVVTLTPVVLESPDQLAIR